VKNAVTEIKIFKIGQKSPLKIELPYDPAIPFLGIYLKEFKSTYNIVIRAYPCLLQHCSQ
jgi:hypothetical protein